VNEQGQVEGTCIGTGMNLNPAFYYNLTVNTATAYGYGSVILVGSEILWLIKIFQIVTNDSVVMVYSLGAD
jgi:hypothetical protein